jgi:hypothetical protein
MDGAGQGFMAFNLREQTSGNWFYKSTDHAQLFRSGGSAGWLWSTAPSGTVNTAATLTERMRLNQIGNLGIGTASPAYRAHVAYDSANVLGVYRDLDVASVGAAGAFIDIGARNGGTFVAGAQIVGVLNNPATTGYLSFATLNTTLGERMRIDSTGNVGINTTSPATYGRFSVVNNGTRFVALSPDSGISLSRFRYDDNSAPQIQLQNLAMTAINHGLAINWGLGTDGTTAVNAGRVQVGAETTWTATASTQNSYMQFATAASGNLVERARIDSAGNVLIGMTASGNGRLTVDGTGSSVNTAFWGKSSGGATIATGVFWNATTTGDSRFIEFYTETTSTLRGNIDFNRAGTAVRYNTSSDARLKKDIVDAPSAGALLDSVQVRSFGWKDSDSHTDYGFVAQELAAVVPDAVSEGDSGEVVEKAWGVDYSKLVPMLVKEIQELRARVAALENA